MNDAVQRFIERMGLLAETDGFPRISGRLLGLLLVEDRAFSLDELAETLRVSKGSISTNARLLERLGAVERSSSPGDRRDFYRLSDNPWEQMFSVVRERMRRAHDALAEGRASLPPEMEAGRRRLGEWQRFYAFMLEELESRIERWNARRSEPEPRAG